jgi:proline iminopeptidase
MRVDIGGGVRLFFDVEGAGLVVDGAAMRERPTLVLLHGGPGFDHASFKPAFSALTDVAQVVYYDHRGQGRSDRDKPANWNLATWVDDVVRFCDALGIEHPIVLGNSFGGMVAMAYGARHPGHAAKLVLSSTSAHKVNTRVHAMFERLGGPEARAVSERFWDGEPSTESRDEYMRVCLPLYTQNPGYLSGTATRTVFNYELMDHWRPEHRAMDLLPELASITVPTLVLAGEMDPVCPVEDAEEIAAALPQDLVRFERLAGCGHGSFRDKPEETFAILRDFIAT